MKKQNYWMLISFVMMTFLFDSLIFAEESAIDVKSPDGKIIVSFDLTKSGSQRTKFTIWVIKFFSNRS